uniref:NDT80 domain-containing protein n=1 Tax=Syphacia muris TaxID=451379 RepID=A0A0N5AEA4_9BILA
MRFLLVKDPAFCDPLSDCTAEFDIIRFIGDNDILEEPVPEQNNLGVNRNSGRGATGMFEERMELMYQNPTRLPYSPPITDISAAGSSGSPSSTSDSPFSPDTYQAYQGLNGNVGINNGLILGINPSLTLQRMNRNEVGNKKSRSQNGQMLQPTSLSFEGDFRNNSYPSQPQQSSTIPQTPIQPPTAVRQDNKCNEFMFPANGYQADAFNNVMNPMPNDAASMNNQRGRKRIRAGPPAVKVEGQQEVFSLQSQMGVLPSPVPGEEFEDSFHQRTIRFTRCMEDRWAQIYDCDQRLVPRFEMHVVADKGFNYSNTENCFVNQKKNHFQITAHIDPVEVNLPWHVKVGEQLLPIREFNLILRGVKSEMPTSEIDIKQSTTDRKPAKLEPFVITFQDRKSTKATVSRLHFEKTTMNNQRKNGRSNPDQKYFLLIVKLVAKTESCEEVIVQAFQSEKVIVRASNPGQFESSDAEATWQKSGSTIYYNNGCVAIGLDKALGPGPLSVGGDIYYAGVLHRPSDRRVKEDIHEIDTKSALSRLEKIRVVEYAYKPEIASEWGLTEESRHRVGVIAQELANILPDAVTNNGDFLQVDDSRIFYETVAAATELSKLTGSLEHKLTAVEKLSHKLAKLHKQRCKEAGSIASGFTEFSLSDKSDSVSRISLTSSTPSFVSKRTKPEKKRYHCQSPACHRSEPSVCSAKVTQLTTIILVVVMTICLVAMSTLYALDWHRRTFGTSRYASGLLPPTAVPSAENSSTAADEGWMGNVIGNKAFEPPRYDNGPPLTACCGHEYCRTYCCSSVEIPSIKNSNSSHQQQQKPTQQSFLATESQNLRSSMMLASPLPSGVNIQVLTLNVTIDERYCSKTSCDPQLGIYTLFVPISPYLPTISLEIKIDVVDRDSYIGNCGARFPRLCSFNDSFLLSEIAEEPISRKISEEVFELPVGNYIYVMYRFRVGYTAESCNLNETQRGRSFDEYNLVFYRLCDYSNNLELSQ